MEARFGRIILQQVDKALQEEPDRDNLLTLLQIADPSFSSEDLGNSRKEEKTLRALKLLIHPDKHKNDKAATERFQKAQIFFEQAVAGGAGGRSRKKRKLSVKSNFHVEDQWPFLSSLHKEPVAPVGTTPDPVQLEKIIAYKCVNYRGAIAHGKNTELRYDFNSVQSNAAKSAQQIFRGHGGYKTLESVEEIKNEISAHGPVISNSFHLQAFLNASMVEHQGGCHPVMIVGWRQTDSGEVWLVRTFKGDTDIAISIGQYLIEEVVLAPVSDFTDEMWQKEDKVFVAPGLREEDGWYNWTAIMLNCESSKLEALFKDLGCSWGTAISHREPFVIREEDNKARSRYAHLTDIEWVEDKQQWKISADFCDQEWES